MNPTDLLVIVPSRGRPHAVAPLAQAWTDTEATAKLLLCVDLDDPAIGQYMDACEEHGVELLVAPLRRPSMTINEVACRYANSWAAIGYCRDDFHPTVPGWDQQVTEAAGAGAGPVDSKALFPASPLPSLVVAPSALILKRGYLVTPAQWQAYVGIGRVT